ncbi:hypothetical protein CYY_004553 [Polysphondylium violaceum]|uniref:Uncharacterized protein n=1 Tax=Polysphondylium violaceum TaxID=133409 RepID=A0A8J4PW06_9MYCE|nr:hypothetical protein CYY_004553 [Polysphondylium violaceum]
MDSFSALNKVKIPKTRFQVRVQGVILPSIKRILPPRPVYITPVPILVNPQVTLNSSFAFALGPNSRFAGTTICYKEYISIFEIMDQQQASPAIIDAMSQYLYKELKFENTPIPNMSTSVHELVEIIKKTRFETKRQSAAFTKTQDFRDIVFDQKHRLMYIAFYYLSLRGGGVGSLLSFNDFKILYTSTQTPSLNINTMNGNTMSTKELLDALETTTRSFKEEKDLLILAQSQQLIKSYHQELYNSHQQFRHILEVNTRKVNELEKLVDVEDTLEMHQEKMVELNREKLELEKNIELFENDISIFKKELDLMSQTKKELEDKEKHLNLERNFIVPDQQFCLSLYSNITGTKWSDNNSSNGGGKSTTKDTLSGVIFPLNENQNKIIQPFSIDKKSLTEFQIVNRMWELIED